ncbi:T9SS type A sorting domain-containing protein [Zobellia uliginosa]|nr:T9SS type A sorting domain-containing protein [Zobellia uliginosa]
MKLFYFTAKLSLTFCLCLMFTSLYSQGEVTIDHKTKRVVNGESFFKRKKYFNIHQLTDPDDPDFKKFKTTYGMADSYRGGRLLDSPMKKGRNGNFPAVNKRFTGVRSVEDRFASGFPNDFFYDGEADYSKVDMTDYIDRLTNYIRDYYRYEEEQVPKYIEPLNEPMVHAVDFYPEGRATPKKYLSEKINIINTRVSEFHRELGKKIHATPELANMKVAGYASAFPMFESNDFRLWTNRYKRFIDIAGKDVDVFSLHLYDGVGVNNSGGRRSGSNVEAILDMVETYSKLKLNTVKPIAVTEYGRLVADRPGWPGDGVSNYDPVENSQALRSQMHMAMSFIERGGDIVYSIPFTMAKTPPTAKYSKSGLWNRVSRNPDVWEYTPRVKFFEIWKNVRGKRVQINSSNIDVQAQAFVNKKKLYVVLNNLNDETQTVDLNLLNKSGLQGVAIKRLKVFLDRPAEITQHSQDTAPKKVSLEYGESVVLTYTFDTEIALNNTITSKKYYADSYLKAIEANKKLVFNFKNVTAKTGVATIRVSIGRAHAKNRRPKIYVNHRQVDYSGDVVRGYDQGTRSSFFGTLEIPVAMDRLKSDGKNVRVEVEFPDQGGHVSSVVLQVENYTDARNTAAMGMGEADGLLSDENDKVRVYPNPVNENSLIRVEVKTETKDPSVQISMRDMSGKLVYRESFDKGPIQIPTAKFREGIYFMNIASEGTTVSKKIIIE